MGNIPITESPLLEYLKGEFERVKKESRSHMQDQTEVQTQIQTAEPERDVLYLQEVLKLRPPEGVRLNFKHLGTLWKLDADHDGAVSLDELIEFAEFCRQQNVNFRFHEFMLKFQAVCVMELWETIKEDKGEDLFCGWLCKLIQQRDEYRVFERFPAITFFSRDIVMTLYDLLGPVGVAQHVDQQGFLDLLQQVGEQMDLMPLSADELDDWVPDMVVRKFLKHFVQNYCKLFRELDLQP